MALSYPLELDQNPDFYRSMVELTCYKTEPVPIVKAVAAESLPKTSEGGIDYGEIGSRLFDLFDPFTQGKKDIPTNKNGEPAIANEKINRAPGVESIRLYMPVGFSQTDTFSYDVSGIGAAGALGLGVAQAGGGMVGAIGAAIGEGTAAISDIMGAVLGSGAIGPMATARIGSAIGGQTGNAIELAGQATTNPNIRAAFKGVGPRRFQFLFNMIPRNGEESAQIVRIIDTIRKYSYPKDMPETRLPNKESPVSLAYEYPYLWRVVPKVKTLNGFEVQAGTPIKYCFIESISVVNNPIGNNTYHDDGMPVQFDLSLNFVEYRTLSRKEFKFGKEIPYSPIDADAEGPSKAAGSGVGGNGIGVGPQNVSVTARFGDVDPSF